MKLVGVTMVRDEVDILELMVRHNLERLDHLIILDHNSRDGTRELLRSLKSEGLPITTFGETSQNFEQGRKITEMARMAAQDHGADFVFPIDADEFLNFDRQQLYDDLRAIPEHGVAMMRWDHYIPIEGIADSTDLASLLRFRVPDVGIKGLKLVLSRRHALDTRLMVYIGNHHLLDVSGAKPRAIEGVALAHGRVAHLPFRSMEQLYAKALCGYFAILATHGKAAEERGVGAHWKLIADQIMAGQAPSFSDLGEIVARLYQYAEDETQGMALIDDPVSTKATRRYPAPQRSALQRLAIWTNQFVLSSLPKGA